MVDALKRCTKRVSSSRLEKCRRMRVRVRVWRVDGPGGVVGRRR